MSKDHEDYVRRIQEETQRYSQSLLAENESLRARIAALEVDCGRLEEKARGVDVLQATNEGLRAIAISMAAEQQRFREQAAALREELTQHEKSRLDLADRLRVVEDENRRSSKQYVEVEQQNLNLANLYVASYRLHGTLDRGEVIQTIQEIVTNLVGSEEMGLFELDEAGGGLTLVASFGIDANRFRRIRLGAGVIGRVAVSGETHVSQRDGLEGAGPEEGELSACVPLKLGGRVTGVLAVFRLLPQKPGLEPLDNELFDLLADQAATALYCTALHARLTAEAAR
jgi:hypothetical protein